MIEQLKKKFNESTKKSEKLQVLTVLPQSWTLQRIQEEFGATQHMARKAKELVLSKGVLSTPNSRPSKTLSDRTVQLVKEFYLSDAVSRMMAGTRDYISVMVNGKKTKTQKRLLLSNLIEAHRQFQNGYPEVKVGRSKFMELRPKNVVLAGTAGTHNVCVCVLYQNVKLMFEGCKLSTSTHFKEMLDLPDDVSITYKHLLDKLSCNPAQPECYLRECSMCSNTNVEGGCNFCDEDDNAAECAYCSKLPKLKASLMEIFNDMGVDEISWLSVDRS